MVNVQDYGAVTSNVLGYDAGVGPGAGSNGTGASYGGYGTSLCGTNIANEQAYGSIMTPTDLGSGGGNCLNYTGGAGGGKISILASYSLVVEGTISADGGKGSGCAGSGSGGTIRINATTMAGDGFITANGGTNSGSGGLGSGGRIVIETSQVNVSNVQAFGGKSNCSMVGGAGTIYFAHNRTLLVSNYYSPISGATPVSGDFFAQITTLGVTIVATECVINTTSLSLTNFSSLVDGNCLDDGILQVSSLYLDASSQILFQNDWWTVEASEIYLYGVVYASTVFFTSDSYFLVGLSGGVNTNGGGFGPAEGPGAGATDTTSGPGSGAGHGATGAKSCGTTLGGDQYDNPMDPSVPGSGGGNSGSLLGGAGGGMIQIVASTMQLEGYLTANGLPGNSSHSSGHSGSGGGSGGSISIQASELTILSSAYISATGGNGGIAQLGGGGGAGGCIFVNVTITNAVSVNATVAGGVTPCISTVPSGTMVRKCNPGYAANNLFQCVQCQSGYYSSNGYACLPCAPGSFAYYNGASECSLCNPGTYINVEGASSCYSCQPNTYASGYGQTNCSACSPGYISNYGAAQCFPCGPGTYQQYTECVSCAPGAYSNQTANTECNLCSLGTFNDGYGFSVCYKCTPGSHCSYTGCTGCFYCQPGTYANASGLANCALCPVYSYQYNSGQSSCLYCATAYLPGQTYCAANSTTGYYTTIGYTSATTTGYYTTGNSYTNTHSNTYSTTYSNTYTNTFGNSSSESNGLSSIDIFLIVFAVVAVVAIIICCVAAQHRRRRLGYTSIQPNEPQPSRRPPPMEIRTFPPPPPGLPPLPPPRLNQAQSSIQDAPSAPLHQDSDAPDARNQECVVCCDAKKETVLLPCGHIATCEDCTRALIARTPKCPICRNPIASFVRMYDA